MIPVAVSTVDLARIQFATTSLYHFLFVPLTLGLAPLVAVMQTLWRRTADDEWLRLTRFFGTLLLINFAIGHSDAHGIPTGSEPVAGTAYDFRQPRPIERRRSLAVEPMTCPPNAFRTGEGVVELDPGESVTGRWGIAPGGIERRA